MTENQKRKEDIARYVKILEEEKVWTEKGMLDYFLKSIDSVIELENGSLVAISKPHIEKYMGTGYSDCGQGMSYEEARKTSSAKRKDFEYFIKENINRSGLVHHLDALKDKWLVKSITNHYCTCPENSKVKCVCFSKEWEFEEDQKRYNLTKINDNDIQRLIEGYEQALERFKKRIETYLKKFGLEKCDFGTYWLDR